MIHRFRFYLLNPKELGSDSNYQELTSCLYSFQSLNESNIADINRFKVFIFAA